MRIIIWVVIVMNSLILAQNSFNSFLNEVNSMPIEKRQAKVDSFWNEAKKVGIPYTDKEFATFLYRSTANLTIKVAGDFNGWQPSSSNFAKIEGTDLYYSTYKFTETARLDYKLIVNENWILDPNNPNYCYGGFGPNSELAMPKYVKPWEIKSYPNTKKGTTETLTIYSSYTNRTYTVRVYLPYNYNLSEESFPTVYFNDGDEYLTLGEAKNIFDNLIDSSLTPSIIGVFVVPTNRNDEYAFALKESYTNFVVKELVPYIDSKYRTIKSANKRAIIGTSLGGNISGYISFNYPEVFGLSGWHSPAFWVNNQEVSNLYKNNHKKDIKIYTVFGTYEGSSISGIVPPLVENLKNKGYLIGSSVYDEGHSWGLWKATLDEILIFLFNDVVSNKSEIFDIKKNDIKVTVYPNPANPDVNIKFYSNNLSTIKINIISIAGKIVKSYNIREITNGENNITIKLDNLPSGMYILNFQLGKDKVNRKLLLLR